MILNLGIAMEKYSCAQRTAFTGISIEASFVVGKNGNCINAYVKS